ncbi:MAG: prephenate dehydratase [Lentisphaerales bacterium]|jgi:chorismate mutase/prephenate dehydratase|nr:MAG: prephenate dehydratase [Lentisphaerales bacterium]
MTLDKLRKTIDDIDTKLVDLLNQRIKTAIEIGKLKESNGAEPYVPQREKEVLARVQKLNPGPLPAKSLSYIYREIMSASLALEKELKVAYLGPAATFSHGAARERFGSSVEYVACESVAAVFEEVEKQLADYGVVPIENSIQGPEAPTLDRLVDAKVKICAETIYPISHCLLSRSSRDRIRKVYSHPQALGQCNRWLRMEMPGVEQVSTSSTAKAAELAAIETDSSAIASRLAAEIYVLDIVASNIEDIGGNETRFLVLGQSSGGATGNDKTSVIFSVKHKAGSLHNALESFRKFGLNMTKIESRPSRSKSWEYNFFVDFEGHTNEEPVAEALKDLSSHCTFLTVLGSYPRACRPSGKDVQA